MPKVKTSNPAQKSEPKKDKEKEVIDLGNGTKVINN